ncbi:tyrosine-protein kinase HTK16-like [Gigantopelta aegis]|uniref:tyrosine-protein kinase HTK16-like n=1 Tax=Gigantopelta aegis TaxID=1735272 RepID=UPI001B88E143|nr:tyrosine-protein kinase HTK16-like [Gigantopelta aegis]
MNEDDVYVDEDETIYANNEIVKLANVNELLKTRSLDELLRQDALDVEKADENVTWYHGKISRESAESILEEALEKQGSINGLFLVRDSTASESDFSLSLVSDNKIYHFQIHQKFDGIFHIDDGPAIQGLDKLVVYYINGAYGLPTQLSSFCKGSTPPSHSRKLGVTNLLHRAVLEGDRNLVHRLLRHPKCPNVDAKNSKGSAALHIAAFYGFDDVIDVLLDYSADVKLLDTNGHTALHRACVNNHPGSVAILMSKGHSNAQERCPHNGWVPMHEAAMKGYINCIKMLVKFNAASFPRSKNNETPWDLAEKYGRRDCVQFFGSYKLADLPHKPKEWFHPEVNRQGVQELFEVKGMRDGLFLIQRSRKQPGWHILSLCYNRRMFNYEIRITDYRSMDYHDGEMIEVPKHDDYYNTADIMKTSKHGSQGIPRPMLPPRPTDDEFIKKTSLKSGDSTATRSQQPPPPPPPAQPPPNKQLPKPEIPEIKTNLNILRIKDIKIGKELGQGEYGSVLKGTYTVSRSWKRQEKIDVALKTFHPGSVQNPEDFLKEAEAMQGLDHPCITKLIGVCRDEKLMLVEEYIALGSMLDYLLDYAEEISENDLNLWAAQIASGMVYLEEKRLVHRDLAARNILLKSKQQVKISDFGLSRAVGVGSDYYKATHGGRWPIKWYAPESVNYGQFSHASDVWSYGVTLWEMFSLGMPPYGDMKGIEVIQFIERGKRLSKPEKCPDQVYEKMLECWSMKPECRPTFNDLNVHFKDPVYASIHSLIFVKR